MPNYQAITSSTFADLRWKRHTDYSFAALDPVAALVTQEVPKAAMSLPIAFVQQADQFIPAALQGFQPGQNLWIAADGRWIGRYIPAAYRGYPFTLAQAPNDQRVLCIDMDSGLVGPQHPETFFDTAGAPSQGIQEVLNFLQNIQANQSLTRHQCAALAAESLIAPWPITVKGPDSEQTLQGLYRIDEAQLNSLSSDALHRIHQVGALPMAYSQLLSMQHLAALGQLAQAKAQAQAAAPPSLPTTPTGDLDLSFLDPSGTIRFG